MFKKTRKRKNKIFERSPFEQAFRNRLVVFGVCCLLGFSAIVGRLIYLQVLRGGDYRQIARGHLESKRELPGQRGAIVDRNGEHMAVDLVHYSVAIRPGEMSEQTAVIAQLSASLGLSKEELRKKIGVGKSFVYLKHRASMEEAEALQALKLSGLVLEKKFSRYYPYKNTGAQLVGYCDFDNHAKAGLELEYESYLNSKPGWSIFLRDALGNQFPSVNFPAVQPRNGMTIETTVDMVYQGILDEELRAAVEKHQASNGTALLMNPYTGEILGMANYPGFDPNQYNRYDLANYRNRVITDLYEPGSTFKMVAMTMALEQLHLDLDQELVFCENGRFQLVRKDIADHDTFGWLTARQVFEKSSNIGVIKLADKFKPPDFYRYARDFGFGARSEVDLPAESSGILHQPGDYSQGSIYYMSIGYEVAVTPLQIASAYAAVANGGLLMKPYVMQRVLNDHGEVVAQNRPTVIRQVISPETAGKLKTLLHGCVENGTGRTAWLPDIPIAGKTGTAQKLDQISQSYSSNHHVGSFVGFFPVESPRFVLMVVLNNPRNQYYGSAVAAPAFRNIARRIAGLPGEDIRPFRTQLASSKLPRIVDYLPALEGMSLEQGRKELESHGLGYQVIGEGELIVRQEPAAYSDLAGVEKVILYTERKKMQAGDKMPDVVGLSLKEALQELSQWNVPLEIQGHGSVVSQKPGKGSSLQEMNPVILVCKP